MQFTYNYDNESRGTTCHIESVRRSCLVYLITQVFKLLEDLPWGALQIISYLLLLLRREL